MSELLRKAKEVAMSISNLVTEQRETDAQMLEQNSELDGKQAKRVSFWRWLVQTRKVIGDVAEDVERNN